MVLSAYPDNPAARKAAIKPRKKARWPLSWWQKIKQHPFIAAGIIVALLALIVLIIAVVLSNGTGFNGYTVKSIATETTMSPQTKVTTTAQSQPGKTLWDLLQLLAALAIPVVVGFGAAWFTAQQGKVSKQENKDNQREKALQDYIDKMSELLLVRDLRESKPEGEVRMIARVRTLTVLRGLDVIRKASVLQFLQESGLIDKNKRIIDLSGADLSKATLNFAHLSGADLSHADLGGADLSHADLRNADLSNADLSNATLSIANLSEANLSEASLWNASLWNADLSGADLRNAHLNGAALYLAHLRNAHLSGADLNGADLSNADLNGADLSNATLSNANLRYADLRNADLRNAHLSVANFSFANLKDAIGITTEELEKQIFQPILWGATMPDGTKHPQ